MNTIDLIKETEYVIGGVVALKAICNDTSLKSMLQDWCDSLHIILKGLEARGNAKND